METKSVISQILFCLAVMVPLAEADSREEWQRCYRRPFEEDGVVEGVEWDVDAEEVTFVRFFFLSPHAPWNGSEDLLKIELHYETRDESWRRTDLLFVPPVLHGQFPLPRPTLNASLIPLPDLRFGWNDVNLTLVGDPFESRRLYVDNVTTGVSINPRGSVNLTVKGLDPRVNCNINYGVLGYEFSPSAPPPVTRVFGFFWNETRNVTFREDGGRQFIYLSPISGLPTVTTLPGGKSLTLCRPQNVSPEFGKKISHLMRECRPGWEEVPGGYKPDIFASVEDLKEDKDVFVAKNCGFVQLNSTRWTRKEGSWFGFLTYSQWPTNVFYDDVFPLEGECPPYPVALLCVDIALGIFQFGLIASIVSYSLKLWRQKKENKKLAEERERLKKEFAKKFTVWYVNAYPGEIKKLIDERKERKRQLARARPSLLVAEEEAYDSPSVSIVTKDSTRRLQRLESDPYETLPEFSPTLVSGPGKGSGPSVLLDLQGKKASFTTDATDATGSCPAKL